MGLDHPALEDSAAPMYFDPASLTRIKVGRWLTFEAEQEMERAGHAFTWRTRRVWRNWTTATRRPGFTSLSQIVDYRRGEA